MAISMASDPKLEYNQNVWNELPEKKGLLEEIDGMSKYQQIKSSTFRKIGKQIGWQDATGKVETKYYEWQAWAARNWAQDKKLEKQFSQMDFGPKVEILQKDP